MRDEGFKVQDLRDLGFRASDSGLDQRSTCAIKAQAVGMTRQSRQFVCVCVCARVKV